MHPDQYDLQSDSPSLRDLLYYIWPFATICAIIAMVLIAVIITFV